MYLEDIQMRKNKRTQIHKKNTTGFKYNCESDQSYESD